MQQPKLTLDALGKLDDFLSGRTSYHGRKIMTKLPTLGATIGPALPSPKSVMPPKEYAAAKAKRRAQRVAHRKNRR
jgi:hypothetical protein